VSQPSAETYNLFQSTTILLASVSSCWSLVSFKEVVKVGFAGSEILKTFKLS
jgi:hypothetical protein